MKVRYLHGYTRTYSFRVRWIYTHDVTATP
ncbi:MAG: hypothetical protein JWN13_2861 [Betaproteobacteria bacterium]|nr:hypothetical protein [Betaproteobacteria bacterium]